MPARLRALDALRVWAMLAGVGFHAALAHSPRVQPFFPTADASQAPGLDAVLWPLHLVRMPVFFVIAGLLAARSLARRGMAGLLRERARRLLVPLLVLAPLLHLLMAALLRHAAATAQRPSPLLRWLREPVEPAQIAPPPGTGHLWFLHCLLLLCVLLWVARTLAPPAWGRALRALPLGAWLIGLPLLIAPALASVSVPHPAPEGLLPQFWALALYGAFFAFGFCLDGARLAQLAQGRTLAGLALAAGGALAGFFHAGGDALQAQAGAALGLASAGASAWGTLLLLGLAQRALQAPSRAMAYLADAAYWVYLVHLPLLFALQFAWLDWAAPWTLSFPASIRPAWTPTQWPWRPPWTP